LATNRNAAIAASWEATGGDNLYFKPNNTKEILPHGGIQLVYDTLRDLDYYEMKGIISEHTNMLIVKIILNEEFGIESLKRRLF
jgi:hypothetical protein